MAAARVALILNQRVSRAADVSTNFPGLDLLRFGVRAALGAVGRGSRFNSPSASVFTFPQRIFKARFLLSRVMIKGARQETLNRRRSRHLRRTKAALIKSGAAAFRTPVPSGTF